MIRREIRARVALTALALAVLVLAGGCAAKQVPGAAPRPVSHVVLFWLNDPGDPQAIAKMTEAAPSFKSIPGVLEVVVGRALPSDRPVVDASFDLGFVITFASPGALEAYLADPKHQEALRTLAKPLVRRMQVYDIVAQAGP